MKISSRLKSLSLVLVLVSAGVPSAWSKANTPPRPASTHILEKFGNIVSVSNHPTYSIATACSFLTPVWDCKPGHLDVSALDKKGEINDPGNGSAIVLKGFKFSVYVDYRSPDPKILPLTTTIWPYITVTVPDSTLNWRYGNVYFNSEIPITFSNNAMTANVVGSFTYFPSSVNKSLLNFTVNNPGYPLTSYSVQIIGYHKNVVAVPLPASAAQPGAMPSPK